MHASPSAFVPPLVVPLVPPLVVPLVPVSAGQSVPKFAMVSCEQAFPSRHESWLSVVEAQRLEQLSIAFAAGSPHDVAFVWQRELQSAVETGVEPEVPPEVPDVPDVPPDVPVVVLLHAAPVTTARTAKTKEMRIAAV